MTAKLGLGTAQFGLDYGISNNDGRVKDSVVSQILARAYEAGIRVIDTAALYGISEEVLGQTICHPDYRIVTKTPFFASDVITPNDVDFLEQSLQSSLQKLKQASIYGLLIHNANDMQKKGFEYIWQAMYDFKQRGLVQKIGMSVYSGYQIDYALEHYIPDLVQLPINVFDQRLMQSGHIAQLKKHNIEIHARSVFLQGLLLMGSAQVPEGIGGARVHVQNYHEQIARCGMSPLEASLAFALAKPEIDCVIVGVCSQDQLQQIVAAALCRTDCNFAPFALQDEKILNPALWQ